MKERKKERKKEGSKEDKEGNGECIKIPALSLNHLLGQKQVVYLHPPAVVPDVF